MSTLKYGFSIKIIYNTFVPDNATNFHTFNDEKHIFHFMANADVFEVVFVEEDEHHKDLQEETQE